MSKDSSVKVMLAVCATVLVIAALQVGRSIFAPVAFALFIIAIVWPVQKALEARLPKLLALLGTVALSFLIMTALGSLVLWGFGRAGHWLASNAARFQELYAVSVTWFEGHGIYLGSLAAEHFNVGWLIRVFNEIRARLYDLTTFALVTSIFAILGLLEVGTVAQKLSSLSSRQPGPDLKEVCETIGAKFRTYMVVRSVMSVITGLMIWAFALAAGLELATAWGAIAFVLNYIPFLGPLVATLFPTLFALIQSESWQMPLMVFLGLNVIQALIGSYIEPRVAGSSLSISPFVVMLAVFFWSFIWGIPGTFIGVPIVIAVMTICEHYPSTQWIDELLSGEKNAS